MKRKLSILSLILVLVLTSVFVMAVPASAASSAIAINTPNSTAPVTVDAGTTSVTVNLTTTDAAENMDIEIVDAATGLITLGSLTGQTSADGVATDYVVPITFAAPAPAGTLYDVVATEGAVTSTGGDDGVVIGGVDILSPTGTALGAALTGGSVEVTAELTVESSGYYTLGILIDDNSFAGPTYDGQYSDLIYLSAGTTVVARQVPINVGTATTTCATMVTLDLVSDTESASTMIMGALPGGTIPTVLVGKGVVLLESILDQFVTPTAINTVVLQTGNSPNALTANGMTLVNGVGTLACDGVGMVGDVVAGVKGSVVSNVPGIVNGALKLVNEICGLFSTATPIAP